MNIKLAVDMGGSKLMVGFVDAEGKVRAVRRCNWSAMTGEAIMRDVVLAAKNLGEAYPQYKAAAAGVTIPGLADPKRGVWVEASFSGIGDLPVADILQREFGIPVHIDNDTRACALAERRWGGCRGVDDFVWITVSNGIGGAIYTNGRLYTGTSGNAGEVGHIVVEEGVYARKCRCGHSGCAEVHASGRGLSDNYLSLGGKPMINGKPINAKSIDRLARDGDKIALETYRMEGIYLGRVAGICANMLNPSKIIFGGGVAMGFDLFREPLLETIQTHVYINANPKLSVEKTSLGYNAALLGAAALACIGEENNER